MNANKTSFGFEYDFNVVKIKTGTSFELGGKAVSDQPRAILLSHPVHALPVPEVVMPSSSERIVVEIRPMRTQSGLALSGAISNRSLTGWLRFCLQPRYRSVVCTETWPSSN